VHQSSIDTIASISHLRPSFCHIPIMALAKDRMMSSLANKRNIVVMFFLSYLPRVRALERNLTPWDCQFESHFSSMPDHKAALC
jgi:hypothetical protein